MTWELRKDKAEAEEIRKTIISLVKTSKVFGSVVEILLTVDHRIRTLNLPLFYSSEPYTIPLRYSCLLVK